MSNGVYLIRGCMVVNLRKTDICHCHSQKSWQTSHMHAVTIMASHARLYIIRELVSFSETRVANILMARGFLSGNQWSELNYLQVSCQSTSPYLYIHNRYYMKVQA